MQDEQLTLEGTDPRARVALTAFVNPDGTLSHLEISARNPVGKLISLQAFGASDNVDVHLRLMAGSVQWRTAVLEALTELLG